MQEGGGISAPIEFIVAARTAARDIMVEDARKRAREAATAFVFPIDVAEWPQARPMHALMRAIRQVLHCLPDLPPGSLAPAGEALKKLALTLDITARVFSIAAGALPAAGDASHRSKGRAVCGREIDPGDIPYRPGVDE